MIPHIHIATGITPGYAPRAKEFLDTAKANNINPIIILVDFPETPADIGNSFRTKLLPYASVKCQVSKFMLQHGAFVQAFEQADDNQVFVFCDADAKWQRPVTETEWKLFDVPHGLFLAGQNKPDPNQTLADEAMDLSPRRDVAYLKQTFPGHEKMLCRNWGFVVATLKTWRELYQGVIALWPEVNRCFSNAAMVQWISCYVAQLDHKLADLPLTVHAHGHFGQPPGFTRCPDGTGCIKDEPILFAHVL